MDISIGNLTISSFCVDNVEHIIFRKELIEDKCFHKFFPHFTEDTVLKPIINDNEIKLKNSYIIRDNNKLVGWIRIGGIDKDITFDCAVHPSFRKMGYGSMIIDECSNYLFENDIAQEIECVIREDNSDCINCISKHKYKRIGKFDQFYIYKAYK